MAPGDPVTEHSESLEGPTVNTIEPRVAPALLSRRARFDLAMLITAGVASTAFFLLPVWTSLPQPTVSPSSDAAPRASTPPSLDSTLPLTWVLATVDAPPSVGAARRRPVTRMARMMRPVAAFIPEKADAKKPQSRLSRFFLGDGSESVQPFPLALRRPER